jgi:hypothetical protein
VRRLLILFACWSPAPTRKNSYGNPRNLEPCGLLCSPMAKVELRDRKTSRVLKDREVHPGFQATRRSVGLGSSRLRPWISKPQNVPREQMYLGVVLKPSIT